MKKRLGILLTVFSLGLSTGAFAETQEDSLLKENNFSTVRKTVEGDKANFLIQLLLKAGVFDTKGLVGAMNLEVQYIRCSEPVVPRPIARCSVLFNDDVLTTNVEVSRALFNMLRENGFNRTRKLGVRNVVVTNVQCTRPVVPQARGRCSYDLYR